MAFASFPDIWAWIQALPPITQWKTDSMSICIISSPSSQPSLHLTLYRTTTRSSPNSLTFSIVADYNIPIHLWYSKPIKHNPLSTTILTDETVSKILTNIIKDILNYCPIKNTSFLKLPKIDTIGPDLTDIFNYAFLCLSFVISIYEAPADIRCDCLNNLKEHLARSRSREVLKLLLRLLGSNTEEQWMRSMNLAITNWIVELQALNPSLKTPCPLYSYAVSTLGLWKVQLYCPVIAMDVEKTSNPADERLLFSLNFHQLEGVIQLNYQVMVREKWIDVIINIDNIRYAADFFSLYKLIIVFCSYKKKAHSFSVR